MSRPYLCRGLDKANSVAPPAVQTCSIAPGKRSKYGTTGARNGTCARASFTNGNATKTTPAHPQRLFISIPLLTVVRAPARLCPGSRRFYFGERFFLFRSLYLVPDVFCATGTLQSIPDFARGTFASLEPAARPRPHLQHLHHLHGT